MCSCWFPPLTTPSPPRSAATTWAVQRTPARCSPASPSRCSSSTPGAATAPAPRTPPAAPAAPPNAAIKPAPPPDKRGLLQMWASLDSPLQDFGTSCRGAVWTLPLAAGPCFICPFRFPPLPAGSARRSCRSVRPAPAGGPQSPPPPIRWQLHRPSGHTKRRLSPPPR